MKKIQNCEIMEFAFQFKKGILVIVYPKISRKYSISMKTYLLLFTLKYPESVLSQ